MWLRGSVTLGTVLIGAVARGTLMHLSSPLLPQTLHLPLALWVGLPQTSGPAKPHIPVFWEMALFPPQKDCNQGSEMSSR